MCNLDQSLLLRWKKNSIDISRRAKYLSAGFKKGKHQPGADSAAGGAGEANDDGSMDATGDGGHDGAGADAANGTVDGEPGGRRKSEARREQGAHLILGSLSQTELAELARQIHMVGWLVGATSHVRAAVFSHHVFGGSQSMSKEEQLKWLAELLAMGGGGGVFGAKGSAGHGEAKGEGGADDAASTDGANAGQTRQLSADARTALQTMLQGLDPATLRELVPCSHPDCPHNHGHAGDGDGDTGAPTGKGGKKRRKKGKGKKKGSDLVLPANHPMAKYMRKPRRGASKQKLKVSNTLALVYDCYEKKILADDVDDRDGVRCTTPRARSLCMCD